MLGCYMAWFRHVHGIMALALFLAVELQANTVLEPSIGNLTYISIGSEIRLEWNLTIVIAELTTRIWEFRKTGTSDLKTLALIFQDNEPNIDKNIFTGISVIKPATLILKNASLEHNGTYRLKIVRIRGLNPSPSNILVVIQGQPTAVVNCNSSSPVHVKEGGHFECLCNSTGGNPPPSASWYKDGKVVSGPGYLKTTLSLKNITGNDSGNYSCFVESHNLNDTRSVEIEVLLKPTAMTNCSTNVTVKEGDDLECLCYDTRGNPSPRALWYKDGKNIGEPQHLKKILSFKNISKEDAANYSCIVNNTVFEDVKKIEIQVQLKPIAVTNCSTSVTVKEGDDLECLCYDTRGNPSPRALWYKDGKNIGEPQHLKKILSFKNISKEDAANYSCIVNNTVFEDVKKIEIQVQYKPTNIVFKIANQNKYNVIVGENVTITCKAEGFPVPDYIILHNDTSLTNVDNGMTTIMSVNYSDDGQYKCIANNSLGNVSANFNLIVQERPTAETNCSSPFTVKEGDNFVCLCYSSTGRPSPNATWYNSDGNEVGKTESLRKTLLLKNITKENAGNYSCIVKSLDLEDTKQIKLQVQYKPIIKNFTSGLENNTATFGQNLSIKCVAEGFPQPSIVIFHGDTKLTGVVNGVKTIVAVNYTHAGRYVSMVNNSLGNMSASFNLTVKVKVSTTTPNPTEAPSGGNSKLKDGVIAGIAVGCGFFILVVVLICYCCCKHDKCVVCCCCCKHMMCGACCRSNSKKERNESELVLADGGIAHVSVVVEEDSKVILPDGGIANVSVVAKEDFNAYETVDKEKIKPNEEAGTSGDGEPARVDSPPSMPPVYAVVDKKSIKKKSPADEEKPASGEDGNDVPAPGPVYAAVDKVAQKKERDTKPDFLTYACLDPVLLQPDSSKMRDRSREESNYADIDMAKLHSDKA